MAGEAWPRSRRTSSSAWRPSAPRMAFDSVRRACRRGLQCVRGSTPWRSRPSASLAASRRSKTIGSTRCSSPRPCASARARRPAGSRRGAVVRTPTTRYQAIKEEAAQVKIRLTCVMDSYFPDAGVFRHVRLGVACRPEKSPMPSELLSARRRRWPAIARRQAADRQAKASEPGRCEIQRRHNSLGAASFEVRSMVFPGPLRGVRVRGRGAHRGAFMGIEPPVLGTIPGVSLATQGPDRRRGGRREPLLSAAALVSYAARTRGEPVRQVRLGAAP